MHPCRPCRPALPPLVPSTRLGFRVGPGRQERSPVRDTHPSPPTPSSPDGRTPPNPPDCDSVSCLIRARQDVKAQYGFSDSTHSVGRSTKPQALGSLYRNYYCFLCGFALWVLLRYMGKHLPLGRRLYNLKLSINMSIEWCKMWGGTCHHLKTQPQPKQQAASGLLAGALSALPESVLSLSLMNSCCLRLS